MLDEFIADVITILIFIYYFLYIRKRIEKNQLFYVLLIFISGIWILTVSDIISVLYVSNSTIECYGGKATAIGTLIGVLGLLTALAMFPRKNIIYKAIPSIYVISALLSVYLLFSPHLMYCHSELGAMRGELWSLFLLWIFSLLFLTVLIPLYNLIFSDKKVEKLQAAYMAIGSSLVIIYLGIAQLTPIYFENFEYFSAVHILPFIGLLFTIALVKYGMFIVTPTREKRKVKECCVRIENHMINGIANKHTAYRAFRDEISRRPGLIISITPPNLLKSRYLLEKTPIVWLSYFSNNYKNAVVPDRIHFEVMYAAMNFIDKGGSLILIDGAEYLIENFGRRNFAEFVEDIEEIGNGTTIVLAVESIKYVVGLADKTKEMKTNVPDPRVIMLHNTRTIKDNDLLVITTRKEEDVKRELGDNVEILRLAGDYSVDRLIFEGIKKIEDTLKKEVYIDCTDFIISVGTSKNVMNLLKDIIDIIIPKGGKLYMRYTPRAEESPLISQFIEGIQ